MIRSILFRRFRCNAERLRLGNFRCNTESLRLRKFRHIAGRSRPAAVGLGPAAGFR